MVKNSSYTTIAGIDLIKVLGIDMLPEIPSQAYKGRVFFAENILGCKLVIVRLYFLKNVDKTVLKTDIRMVLNEMMPPNKEWAKDVCIDFVFTPRGRLLGMIPIPFIIGDKEESLYAIKQSALRYKLKELNISYYDSCELWLNLKNLQPTSENRLNYIKLYKKRVSFFKKLLHGYINSIYGLNSEVIKSYGNITYIYQYNRFGGWCFKHFSLDDIETYIAEGKLDEYDSNEAKIYISLPGTYTPGKYIDIGYYNAIEGSQINIDYEDIVFVIGFGAGLDVIQSAKKASLTYGIEINPFAVASAKANIKLAGLQDVTIVEWNDARELVKGNIEVPKNIAGRITKLLWNLPYESTKPKKNPLRLKDFFDNYSVVAWLAPYLANNSILSEKWSALFWRIVDNSECFENYFKLLGFQAISYDDENICIIAST